MTTLLNIKLGESRGVARIWLEGQKLAHAGLKVGDSYAMREDLQNKRLELVKADAGASKTFTVSKRERNGVTSPLMEIRTDLLKTLFEGCEKVRVAIRKGRILVTALQIDLRIKERVERLKTKLLNKEKLATGSLFLGGGVLDKAIHSGLMAAGVAAFIQVGVEIEGDYLDVALRNSPELWSEHSIAINSDVRDVGFANTPPLDICVAGIPCTGASLAGRAKNKLEFAEDHSSAGTLFFDALEFIKSSNPIAAIIENVPQFASTASMAVIRSVLTSLGYQLYETVLNGVDFGAIENRNRMVLVAITKGLDAEFSFPVPGEQQPRTVGSILEDIPVDSTRWKSYDYLEAKQVGQGRGQGVRPSDCDC